MDYKNFYDVKTINNGFNIIKNDAMKSYEYPNRYMHLPGANVTLGYACFDSYDYIYQYFNHIGLIDSSDFNKTMYWIGILESCMGYQIVNLKTKKCIYYYYD